MAEGMDLVCRSFLAAQKMESSRFGLRLTTIRAQRTSLTLSWSFQGNLSGDPAITDEITPDRSLRRILVLPVARCGDDNLSEISARLLVNLTRQPMRQMLN